jgi:hypothetical protein
MKKKHVLLICSPNLGLIDSWLPIVHELKKTNKYMFDIFFPKYTSLIQLEKKNVLSNLSFELFGSVIFLDIFNSYKKTTFSEKLVDQMKLKTFLSYIRNSILKIIKRDAFFGDKFFYNLNYIYYLIFNKKNIIKIEPQDLSNYDLIFYDIYEEGGEYFKPIKEILFKNLKFSMSHGSDFPTLKKVPKLKTKNVNVIKFTNSELEDKYYNDNFELDSVPTNFGNPKHDINWINYISSQKVDNKDFDFTKYVLIISRNVSGYLPLDRKLKYLKIIKKNIIDKGYKVVVKLHPKEDTYSGKSIYYEIFGKEYLKKNWAFSDIHVFQSYKKIIFGVSFFSGVVIDLLRVGVPSIELLDLAGLENKVGAADCYYDNLNRLIFRMRHNGIVLGATNEDEFINEMNKIVENREKVVSKLNIIFQKMHSKHKNAITNVIKHIESRSI